MAEAALVATIIGGVSAVAGIVQQRRAGKEQKRQLEIANRIQATKRMRNIRRAIAQARIQRAQVQAAGFELGVSGGTAVQGAEQGVTADLASVIGAANVQFTGQQVLQESQQRISGFQQRAATFGSISSLAGQFSGQQGEQFFAAVQGLTGG